MVNGFQWVIFNWGVYCVTTTVLPFQTIHITFNLQNSNLPTELVYSKMFPSLLWWVLLYYLELQKLLLSTELQNYNPFSLYNLPFKYCISSNRSHHSIRQFLSTFWKSVIIFLDRVLTTNINSFLPKNLKCDCLNANPLNDFLWRNTEYFIIWAFPFRQRF